MRIKACEVKQGQFVVLGGRRWRVLTIHPEGGMLRIRAACPWRTYPDTLAERTSWLEFPDSLVQLDREQS